MKKNFLTKVMTLALAATMALTPVTASAAEKTVVTSKEYHSVRVDCYDEETEVFDGSRLYDYVASLNGCYQPNGYKIYTALDNKTVTVKKTGNYAVIVGGKTAKKDQGSLKFVAPKTGTYKFTFSTKNNVAGGQIFIDQLAANVKGNTKAQIVSFKVNYKAGSKKISHDASVLVTDDPKYTAYATKGSNVLSHYINDKTSEMTKVSGSIKLKKGQFVFFTGRDSGAGYDESDDVAYNFTGFDVSIKKTK
ncbi:hypothetical protein [Butyribacter sp.]|uniref:hypothetical protein n=1 Tax=Butyribacter sp. TaxID=2822465 RepID=UPI002A9B1EA7|nr:hypothetical protein [Butyribacter sp.]